MTVIVKDSFEIRAQQPGSNHAPGLVVVFDAMGCVGSTPGAGYVIQLQRPDGSAIDVAVDELKDHGPSRSFFFRGLHQNDAPIGSRIIWSDDVSSWVFDDKHAVAT